MCSGISSARTAPCCLIPYFLITKLVKNNMVKRILLPVLLLLCIGAKGQKSTIKVLDKSTLQPVSGAVVFYMAVDDLSKWVPSTQVNLVFYNDYISGYPTANANGIVNISNTIYASDSVTVLMPGYALYTTTYANIVANKNVVYLDIKEYTLGDVIISATRFEEKRSDVAQNVQVISANTIAFQSQQTTADVLMQSGGVLVQKSQQGGGSPSIRGFEANRVLLVIDGVRMNNAIFRAGHLQNVLRVDNTMLDKAEIVLGPGSVVYGSDALGGVMHFYTRNPILSNTGKVIVKGGAYARYSTANNEITGHADASIGLKKWGFLTGFTYSQFGDLRQGANGYDSLTLVWKRNVYADRVNGIDTVITNSNPNKQVGTGYHQYDVLQKVLFRPNNTFQHTLNFQFSNTGNVPRYDRLTELTSNAVPKSAEWYYGPEQRMLLAYKFEIFKSTKAFDRGNIILAFQDIKESRHNRNFGAPTRTDRNETVKVYSLNVDYAKKVQGHEIRYGVEGTFNTVNSTAQRVNVNTGTVSAQSTRYPNGGSTFYTTAIYATHSWELSPKVILNDGLRFSYVGMQANFNDTTFYPFPFTTVKQNNMALNGNVGIVYMPGGAFRIAALGSTGFRSPNVDDLTKIFDSAPGMVVLPNPDLKPEYTYNTELTVSKIFAKKITVEINGYYTWARQMLGVGKATFNGQDSIVYDGQLSAVTMMQNNNKAYIYGGYVGLRGDITKWLAISAVVNYTYGRVKSDTVDVPLDHVAPVYGRVGIMFSTKKFRAEFFTLFNGQKKVEDYSPGGEDNLQYATANGMPAWYTLNIRAAYQFNPYLQLQVALENILDRNYRVFASGISAAGRNVMVTLRTNF